MKSGKRRVLVIGYGNPGRLDDGLGPALAAAIEGLDLPGVSVESDYQLTIEHAHDVANYDVVIFADADVNINAPFYFRRLVPQVSAGLGSHDVSPGEIISLALMLFGATTRSYLLGIRGYKFDEFGEILSDMAGKNLELAVDFVSNVVRKGNFDEAAEEFSGTETHYVDICMDRISLN
ncbi:MAG: hydrogenase maturation protease [Kiritimatiellae bacterium]|nr:hydrogenase maturation protease [Kiritimatiellia bacterium]MDD5523165.1 hydrogenase maturation protease [Kiritimatiellia bacterium]